MKYFVLESIYETENRKSKQKTNNRQLKTEYGKEKAENETKSRKKKTES